jgi:hypothetical protein
VLLLLACHCCAVCHAPCRRQLASLQARWEAMAASNLGGNGAAGGAFPSPGPGGANTLVESFTLGWLNLLVNSLWVVDVRRFDAVLGGLPHSGFTTCMLVETLCRYAVAVHAAQQNSMGQGQDIEADS